MRTAFVRNFATSSYSSFKGFDVANSCSKIWNVLLSSFSFVGALYRPPWPFPNIAH